MRLYFWHKNQPIKSHIELWITWNLKLCHTYCVMLHSKKTLRFPLEFRDLKSQNSFYYDENLKATHLFTINMMFVKRVFISHSNEMRIKEVKEFIKVISLKIENFKIPTKKKIIEFMRKEEQLQNNEFYC